MTAGVVAALPPAITAQGRRATARSSARALRSASAPSPSVATSWGSEQPAAFSTLRSMSANGIPVRAAIACATWVVPDPAWPTSSSGSDSAIRGWGE
jgi:hypothetical protein